MKVESWARVSTLFEGALGVPPEEQCAFLDRHCVDPPEVRAEVERLLRLDRISGESFEAATVLRAATWSPAPGTRIGSFTVSRVLASGGMGTVFEAVQERPRRIVALKTMRQGLASPASLQRFQFEVEVLGRLHHPGIAQVYETGTHREGDVELPYFAMELVEGARDLLTYASEEQLSRAARIELFAVVCDAVQHGHQRGVVHRDIKPGNVLVDAAGDPKVIDFGVARIAGEEHAHASNLTLQGQIVGTMRYMSPEQISGRSTEVDTRSDVYSLGCLLHELLTGRPPRDLTGLTLLEISHLVTESEPARPRELPPELGWICLMCLARAPERRYASASELASDLRRHLRHEPVLAGSPGRSYQLKKFLRRHRLPLCAAVAVVAALAVGLVQARVEAQVARREAEKARGIAGFLERTLTSAGLLERGPESRIVDALEEFAPAVDVELAGQPEARAVVEYVIGKSYLGLWKLAEAEPHLRAAWDYTEANLRPEDPLRIGVLASRARLLFMTGHEEEAEELGRKAEELALAHLGPVDETTLQIQGMLAELLGATGELEEAAPRFDALLDRLVERHGAEHAEVIATRGGRALLWQQQGRLEAAREELEQVLALAQRVLPADHFRIYNAKLNLAWILTEFGEFARAEELGREILAWAEGIAGPAGPLTWAPACLVARAVEDQGRLEEAVPLCRRALDTGSALFGEDQIDTLMLEIRLARIYIRLGDSASAEPLLFAVMDHADAGSGPATEAQALLDGL